MITQDEKKALLKRLDTTLDEAQTALKKIDPLQIIYEETQWRVKDIVAHVATWEMEMARGIYTYRRGGEYLLPGAEDRYTFDEDDFNANAAHVRYDDTMPHIHSDWSTARSWLKVLVGAMTPEELEVRFKFPWGVKGTTVELLQELLSHHDEHMREILSKQNQP